MKLFILTIFISSFLFAGGDFFPVTQLTKYEKMDKEMTDKCHYSCGEPATLLPYTNNEAENQGEEIPIAETFPCPYNSCNKNISYEG